MRDYDSEGIRNVAVVGHGASGKTSLVDALCFAAGTSKRHGSIKDGTALTDHLPEEIERGFSISLGCAYAEWMDTKINFIDTPGSLDFIGEAIAGLTAADGALCVVGAAAGVEVGDAVVAVDDTAITGQAGFVAEIRDRAPGDEVNIAVRRGGRLLTLTATLVARPAG